MPKLKEMLRGVGGVILTVVLILGVVYFVWHSSTADTVESSLASDLSSRTLIDETGATFQVSTAMGSSTINPKNNKPGFPVELCWWTKDGKIRADKPYPVLLNQYVNKPGPTFCPDCGRLVVQHNPSPLVPDSRQTPPPTKEEYARRHGGGN
jgi:hypothetical protein